MKKFKLGSSLIVFVSLVSLFIFASKCNAEPNNLKQLEKSEKKLDVTVDTNVKNVDTIQYHSKPDTNDWRYGKQSFTDHCSVIESEKNLKELLLKHGYDIPPVDFDKDIIVYCLSPEDQPVIRIEVDSIFFKKGPLSGLIKTELMGGDPNKPVELNSRDIFNGDPNSKSSFVLVVLPRSATK